MGANLGSSIDLIVERNIKTKVLRIRLDCVQNVPSTTLNKVISICQDKNRTVKEPNLNGQDQTGKIIHFIGTLEVDMSRKLKIISFSCFGTFERAIKKT